MAENGPQSYATHRKFVPLYHYVIALILLAHLARTIWHLIQGFSLNGLLDFALAGAFVGIYLYARIFPLKVQDRVIRLEMQLRLKGVLPADLQGKISQLSADQLVGLRFASDGELPDLVKRTLAGELQGREDIKKAIRDWQPDHLRA